MRLALKPERRKLRMIPLIAATYFMVSGGPYAIEDILGGAGYTTAIVILLVLPFLWSLPTTLMIGELASAIPAEGGFYVWVRRAMGPFWGYQEGWLSLSASVFDMAIYPAFFVTYLGKFNPALTAGWYGFAWSLAVVVICSAWNLRGAPSVGDGSVGLFLLLLSPFVVFVVLGFWRGFTLHPPILWSHAQWSHADSESALSTAVLVAMWNYMGWDNASTVAKEVENPQRNYPRAMVGSALLVAITYLLPLVAMAVAGLSSENFDTGAWVDAAANVGGPWLGWAIVAGGTISGFGMFNALVMSYTRLPVAMAEDRMLPQVITRRNSRGVPYVSVVLCAIAWALALKLPFERLISIDLSLYGVSLILEFVALVILRLREPNLDRPFKMGNLAGAVALGVGPTALIGYALYASRAEQIVPGFSALLFAFLVALVGPVLYWITTWTQRNRRRLAAAAAD